MRIIYRTTTALYFLGIRIAAIFNQKAAKMISGRKQTLKDISELEKNTEPCIWFHCASLGEFEQGRPLIELIRKKQNNKRIIISFFSPSGYEVRKNYEMANEVYYMPFDTPKNAKDFINRINPETAIFVKYELWYFHLKYLQSKNIDTYLISALFRPNQWFFKLGNKFTKNLFNCFTHIFVQNNESYQLLSDKNILNTSISGDTRVDRVIDIANKSFNDPIIEKFSSLGNCIIAGSTHQPDEEILLYCIDNQPDDVKMIIAPHIISDKHIKQIEEKANNNAIRYSKANLDILHNYKFLIIDNIGMLSKIYQFGIVAYIGGGFGKGIHNTLEAAVYGIPVLFGPKYQKFEEAKALIKEGGAFCIKSQSELNSLLYKLLSEPNFAKQSGNKAKQYILKSKGTVEQIFDKIHTSF
jgi:3-deoxy-D-manno-octulosonic-acid transferase